MHWTASLVLLLALSHARAADETPVAAGETDQVVEGETDQVAAGETEEVKPKVWEACPTATVDILSATPTCDPCNPNVYRQHNRMENTMVYTKSAATLKDTAVQGWTRFMMGNGKLVNHCPQRYSCGSTFPIWLSTPHPTSEEDIATGTLCTHYNLNECCEYTQEIQLKNCGDYFVYLLVKNKPMTTSYSQGYCVEPEEQPDICNDGTYSLLEDSTARGELETRTSTATESAGGENTNNWYAFTAGKGTVKRSCPGLNHCGYKYPMWMTGDAYPKEEGKIVHMTANIATSAASVCVPNESHPVEVVKCGEQFYHKFTKEVTYSGFCVDEELADLCGEAVTLTEEWRGTTVEKARDHCDTNGLHDWDAWYRIGVFNNKLPDHCVAPNHCGADSGYFVGGNAGHPKPGDGITGRTLYYSTAATCESTSGGVNAHILNCGDEEGDDFIYQFSKPSGCDKVFCAEQNPCSSAVYTKLGEEGRAGREFTDNKVNDVTLQHGWYRFTEGEGIMSRSHVLPGHSGITYPGWYDGEYPLEEGQETDGKACFTYNSNHCYQNRPVSVRNCGEFYVYHLSQTASNYGYTYEQDVCSLEAMEMGDEWRLQYNQNSIGLSDHQMESGWYEVTVGDRKLASTPTLHRHGGTSKYPGWVEEAHPTEDEGIVERTVYYTTSDTNSKASNNKIYIINCGDRYLYYLRPHAANYFYAVSQPLCQAGSYDEIDQDHRLFSNPSFENELLNSDNKFFTKPKGWYRFMNGNGRVSEWPKIQSLYRGGFYYGYQFPEGSHALVPEEGDMSEEITMEFWNGVGNPHYKSWPWKLSIANCGNYYLYKIPKLHTSYNRGGLVVDDDPEDVCQDSRYAESDDSARLVSSLGQSGTGDQFLTDGWYRLTAGLGYIPTSVFVGAQCSATYHGSLRDPHPTREEGIQENLIQFRSTSASVTKSQIIWVKACEGYYLYRLRPSPGATYRYCEATPGCEHARELEGQWRVNGRKMMTGQYESKTFGDDGWVFFTQGLGRMPESPPPKTVGGCTYSGYIDSHPSQDEGAVPRTIRFPASTETQNIEVENCGDKYVYFLTKTIKNDYCYVADTDVCDENVYRTVNDERRLHYSHRYGTSFTRFDLDNLFLGWVRYTVGEGRMMEEAPALTGMCTTEKQGWINGEHPTVDDGVVKREVCWKFGGEDCKEKNDISIRNCGEFYVYGIAKPPANNQYGHCIEQDKTEVCEGATVLNNPKRGMLTATTEYIHDQTTIVEPGYYRFTSGLGRLTAFKVTDPNCGGTYKMLIQNVLEKDLINGDALLEIRPHTTAFTGTAYRNMGLQCDGYWVYELFHINLDKMAYCVEEDVCKSREIKRIFSTNYQQWLKETDDNEWDVLTPGWYEVMVGNKRLAYSSSDTYDCSAPYPGFITSDPPSSNDGIIPGKVCYRTSDASANEASCQSISMKKCADRELYYLTKSPGANYAMCIETDVCGVVEGIPLEDTWRLFGTPKSAGGSDSYKLGWYKVNIGNEKLAESKEEAQCGALYRGWLQREHPTPAEGTVNTQICYDTGAAAPANCKDAQVVNCGSHFLYHLRPGGTNYGVCIKSAEDSMCKNYVSLDEEWRSTEFSSTIANTDTSLPIGWYRFTTGLGRMPTTCPSYKHGGGHYPSYASDLLEMPSKEAGVTEFNIRWRYTGVNCNWLNKKGYVRNCGEFPVYWLPKQTQGATTYNTEADSCSGDQYTELEDMRRLAWRPKTESSTDNVLTSGWYRLMNGLNKINEECTPVNYGGASYPGWMEGGHPGVGETVDRKVWFRVSTNCKYTSKPIKIKNCGSFFIYRLVPTAAVQYGYTVASEPCDSPAKQLAEEDRSIWTRSTSLLKDSTLTEGWYEFTSADRVMAKSPPAYKSCRTTYPIWMRGEDPSEDEGVAVRTACAVSTNDECAYQKEIKARNCGNRMLYYHNGLPTASSRYCVSDDMDNVCASARVLNEEWRGASSVGTGHADRLMEEGWIKFNSHAKKMANYAVPMRTCGSTYPIWMEGEHAAKGECATQTIWQVNSNTNYKWRSGTIYECQCMDGDFIYYHNPAPIPLSTYESSYCVEEEPCENYARYTGNTRSAWYKPIVNKVDATTAPTWLRVATGLGTMPRWTPELTSCGCYYPGWYDGEMPTEIGQTTKGQYCFRTSATAKCSSPKPAQVRQCDGFVIYHIVPTASANYAYCIDEDVCDVAYEEWGREENHRLRHTSIDGYKSTTVKTDSALPTQWFRMTIGLQKMPTQCVGSKSCGVYYPGWLNGDHPEPADRIVDMEVCFVTGTSDQCCGKTQEVKVVSCNRNSEHFYLYRLYKTPSTYGYCVDESSDDVCKMADSQIQHLTEERHGTGHYYDSAFGNDYQMYPIPTWMTVNVHNQKFIHHPPTTYFCGGVYAGWIDAPEPGPNEGVIATRSCFRENMANEDCYNEQPFKMKNCNGRMRYLYLPPAKTDRNMCVEEDICKADGHKVYKDEAWRLAFTKSDTSNYNTDYRKMDTAPYRGWFRFEGVGNNRITEVQQEYQSCGVQYPGWMKQEHPTEEEGVVMRTLHLTTSATAYTGRSENIYARNCGGFMLYNINFNFYSGKWGLCVDTDVCKADIAELEQPHRLLTNWALLDSTDDRGMARGWYRFTNGFEKMPETCPIHNSCGAKKPGYLAQPHPDVGEGIVERKVCFGDVDQCCVESISVMVKNCGTGFVYRLYPTTTYQKYCVEEATDGMCEGDSYKELAEEWRGENYPYVSTDKHDDHNLGAGWYRFTSHLGRMPEYSSSSQMCGHYYPGYLENEHPIRNQGVTNNRVCFSTSMTNEGQNCKPIRVRNCGSYYVYQLINTGSTNYGYCVAQDQCKDAQIIDDRWRLVVNPYVSTQSTAADNSRKKGWYRFTVGHGTMPQYEPDQYYGGQRYPTYHLGDLPEVADGEQEIIARYAGVTTTTQIRIKNCGEHYIYWLQPTPSAQYVYSVDTDVCLHAHPLDEEWRNMFYVSETEEDLHTDYKRGKDWYRFTTGFQMMAEKPPGPRYSCGTTYAAYLNQVHPTVDDGVVAREVCFKEDEVDDIYQGCEAREQVRVKNCGDYFTYQLNPMVDNGAYCVYNRKTSCEPKVVHAKYGEVAVVNCTLNSEKDFDSTEVEWTKLWDTTLPAETQGNIDISDDKLLLEINDIADNNAGVYALFIPSTSTSELVEVILYSAVESTQKYYIVEEGKDVEISVTFNIVPAPAAADIAWEKLPGKFVSTLPNVAMSADKSKLTISKVAAKDVGTYRCTVKFEVAGVAFTKHNDVIVQLEVEEEMG